MEQIFKIEKSINLIQMKENFDVFDFKNFSNVEKNIDKTYVKST